MTTLYPWGYAKRLVDWDELARLAHLNECDPETAERVEAWIKSRGGHVGFGSAIRYVQPDKSGFAPSGMSFHQLQRWMNANGGFDGALNYAAFDLVCRNGDLVHRSPRWDEVPRQGSGHPDIAQFGVHCNVNGEPWHMQAIEIDGWQTWANNGRRRPRRHFIVQVDPPAPDPQPEPTPEPAPTPPPVVVVPPQSDPVLPIPAGSFTVPTLSSLRQFSPNNPAHVQVWQSQINRWFAHWGLNPTPENGQFDEQTKNATILFQTLVRDREGRASSVDGTVGPQSWGNVFSDC